jgi:hypothetical protein
MRRRRDDFYLSEIAYIIGCTLEDAQRICFDQTDGEIELGLVIVRYEEMKRQRLVWDDPGHIPTEFMTREEQIARLFELTGQVVE